MDDAGEAAGVDAILAISGLASGEDRKGLGSQALLQPPSALSRAAGPGWVLSALTGSSEEHLLPLGLGSPWGMRHLRPGWEGALGHTGFRGHPLSRP